LRDRAAGITGLRHFSKLSYKHALVLDEEANIELLEQPASILVRWRAEFRESWNGW
jgi:hypothetical protein